jgi:hypothetical protein
MSESHVRTGTFKHGSNNYTVPGETLTADSVALFNDSLVSNATNEHIVMSVRQAGIKSIFILADANTTLKTNSSGSPDDTIALVAGKPLNWTINDYTTCPITADITGLYATKSGAAANLLVNILYDGTP